MTRRETPEGGRSPVSEAEVDKRAASVGTIGHPGKGHTTLTPTILPVAIATAGDRAKAAFQQAHTISEDHPEEKELPHMEEEERGAQSAHQKKSAALGRALAKLSRQVGATLGEEGDWIVGRNGPANLSGTER